MTKGILLIAQGHPYYGKMAAALAATLKLAEPGLKIHLAWAGNALGHLSEPEKNLFTSRAEIPESYYTTPKGETNWIRAKMNIYNLSPFDITIYLDCDILWLNDSPEIIFKDLEPFEVTYPNFGLTDMAWAKTEEIVKAYGPGNYWNVHSELIYFKKGEKAERFFKTALHVYDNLKLTHVEFAGAIPDELPFSIAGAITKTYPHKDRYRPIYWHKTEKGFKQVYEIAQKFKAVSMAGNNSSNFEILVYNILSKAAYYKLKLQKPYTWKQKRAFLPERKKL